MGMVPSDAEKARAYEWVERSNAELKRRVAELEAELATANARATAAERIANDLADDLRAKDSYRTGFAEAMAFARYVMRGAGVTQAIVDRLAGIPDPIPPAAILARLLALQEACRPLADIASEHPHATGGVLGHCRRLAALLANEEATDATTD